MLKLVLNNELFYLLHMFFLFKWNAWLKMLRHKRRNFISFCSQHQRKWNSKRNTFWLLYFPNTQEMYFIGRLSKRIIVFLGIKRGKRIIIEENWPKYPNYHSRIMLSPDDLFCIYSLKTTVLIKIQVHWVSIFAFLPKCHHFCY